MNRELAFAILVSALCGGVVMAAGWWPFREILTSSGRALERRAWLRMWVSFGPALVLFVVLCGWVLVEPAQTERLPSGLLLSALPFAVILVRAVSRAIGSLALRQEVTAGTIGLFRPRIILSADVVRALDERALAAALEHERAHARHRDPLRIWLAQLAADLFWPSPTAAARLRCWRRALELARDEEVRSIGVAGSDLAKAIVSSIRLVQAGRAGGVATLSDSEFVEERVARLLRPLESNPARGQWGRLVLFMVSVLAPLGFFLGIQYGEGLVQFILKIL
jgi:hypothetical protein